MANGIIEIAKVNAQTVDMNMQAKEENNVKEIGILWLRTCDGYASHRVPHDKATVELNPKAESHC